jgi:hypothetical protein
MSIKKLLAEGYNVCLWSDNPIDFGSLKMITMLIVKSVNSNTSWFDKTESTFSQFKNNVVLNKRQMRIIKQYKPPLLVLVSGSRFASQEFYEIILRRLKSLPKYSTIIHGGCRGIDTITDSIAKKLKLNVEAYPLTKEDWNVYGRAAGPIRNRQMLDQKPDLVLAFHEDITSSKGTKDTMKEAHRRGIKVTLYDLKTKYEFNGSFYGL